MKILLLADAWSSHTSKWANSLAENEIDVEIFSLSEYDKKQYHYDFNIEVVDFSKTAKKKKDGSLFKSVYLATLPKLKNKISKFKPDILHAHSASSYGLLGALTGFHNYFISTWGSDVFIFPKKSFLHKNLLKYSFWKASEIFSSSNIMSIEASKYSRKKINVINFGVDTDIFKPSNLAKKNKIADFVIGTVKTLDYNYGIEYLIEAFSIVLKNHPEKDIKLLLVGSGGMENELKNLAKRLNVFDKTIFTGQVAYNEVPTYQNMIDLAIFPSKSESFGVSALEASSCEKPIIVSNVGGLPEVVKLNETGFIFESGNISELVIKIENLLINKELREKFGKAGREFVIKNYNWNKNVQEMIKFYKQQIYN